jgi:hypothetical protein
MTATDTTTEVPSAGVLESCSNLLAGNAIFTALHDASGERYTYHLYAAKTGKLKGVIQARLLTGPNNCDDYTELGNIDATTGVLTLTGRTTEAAASVQLVRWLVSLAIAGKPAPAGITLHHAGHCLRCRRLLTVPYPANPYRVFGLGPECGSK